MSDRVDSRLNDLLSDTSILAQKKEKVSALEYVEEREFPVGEKECKTRATSRAWTCEDEY